MVSQKTLRKNKASHPVKWDREADVIVAGYGGAGAAAAIAAHDEGAEVIILESMPQGGGNTRVSMGGFLCPTNAQDAVTYITGLYEFSRSEFDPEVIRVFAEEAIKNVDWIKSLKEGTEVQIYGHAGFPQVPGAASMNKYLVKGKGKGMTVFAEHLWSLLTYAVEEKRKIPVLTDTPAKNLITNSAGEVIGLMAGEGSRDISIRANRAVILTTGGYEYDQKTLQNNVKGFPIYSFGNPGNRGDGIRMAQKAGAGLWHMNCVSCGLGLKVPEFEAAIMIVIRAPGHILVDRHGERFVNESAIESHAGLLAVDYYNSHTLEYTRIPCYAIFDETARLAGPISVATGLGATGRQYTWSRDNSAEIEKGWIIKAETLAELAQKLKINPDTLESTVSRWNRDIREEGIDSCFGRTKYPQMTEKPAYTEPELPVQSSPLENPPFYALELYPSLLNTQGGPRRNSTAQVLDAFGDPIPRLYSAGELGSMWGLIYQGAGNIAECLVFGRIAGRNAAHEKPWAGKIQQTG